MSVRPLLSLGIGSVAGVLHERRRLAQAAIFQDGEYRDAPSGVIRHQNMLSALVDDDVAGICATGRNLVQKCQFAGGAIDGERADRSALLAVVVADLIHRVKEAVVWVDREERWIDGFGS